MGKTGELALPVFGTTDKISCPFVQEFISFLFIKKCQKFFLKITAVVTKEADEFELELQSNRVMVIG